MQIDLLSSSIFLAEEDLSAFYTALSSALNGSSVEPQAETNLIEHQTAHNVLRHLIIADGKRQKKNQYETSRSYSSSSLDCHLLLLILALVSNILSSISPDALRAWILCNRGCFIFVMWVRLTNWYFHSLWWSAGCLNTVNRKNVSKSNRYWSRLPLIPWNGNHLRERKFFLRNCYQTNNKYLSNVALEWGKDMSPIRWLIYFNKGRGNRLTAKCYRLR